MATFVISACRPAATSAPPKPVVLPDPATHGVGEPVELDGQRVTLTKVEYEVVEYRDSEKYELHSTAEPRLIATFAIENTNPARELDFGTVYVSRRRTEPTEPLVDQQGRGFNLATDVRVCSQITKYYGSSEVSGRLRPGETTIDCLVFEPIPESSTSFTLWVHFDNNEPLGVGPVAFAFDRPATSPTADR